MKLKNDQKITSTVKKNLENYCYGSLSEYIPAYKFEQIIDFENKYQLYIKDQEVDIKSSIHNIVELLKEDIKIFANYLMHFIEHALEYTLKNYQSSKNNSFETCFKFLSDKELQPLFRNIDKDMQKTIENIIRENRSINLLAYKEKHIDEENLSLNMLQRLRKAILTCENSSIFAELIKLSLILAELNPEKISSFLDKVRQDEAKAAKELALREEKILEEKQKLLLSKDNDFEKVILEKEALEKELACLKESLKEQDKEDEFFISKEEIKEEILATYHESIRICLEEKTLAYLVNAEFFYRNYFKKTEDMNFAINYYKAIEMELHATFKDLADDLASYDLSIFTKKGKKQNGEVFDIFEAFEAGAKLSMDDYVKILKNESFVKTAMKHNMKLEQAIKTITNNFINNAYIRDIRNSLAHASYFAKNENMPSLEDLETLRTYVKGPNNIIMKILELKRVSREDRLKFYQEEQKTNSLGQILKNNLSNKKF